MRQNGLRASSFVPVVDVDPRVADQLLDLLRLADVAAYSEPAPGRTGPYRDHQVPTRRLDRLWVDRAGTARAREVLDRAVPHLVAELEIVIRDGRPLESDPRLAMSGELRRGDGSDRVERSVTGASVGGSGIEASMTASGESDRPALGTAATGGPPVDGSDAPRGADPAASGPTGAVSAAGPAGGGDHDTGAGTLPAGLVPAEARSAVTGPEMSSDHPVGPPADEPTASAVPPVGAAVPTGVGPDGGDPGNGAGSSGGGDRTPVAGAGGRARPAELDDAAVEAAWAGIIADFDTSPDGRPPWPATEDVLPPRAPRLRRPIRSNPVAPAAGGDLLETDHFVPPPPPVLPRLDPVTRIGWAALVAGPVLLVIVVVFGHRVPDWLPLLGVFTLVGGFALLVSRLRPTDSDDDDTDHHDGAVV